MGLIYAALAIGVSLFIWAPKFSSVTIETVHPQVGIETVQPQVGEKPSPSPSSSTTPPKESFYETFPFWTLISTIASRAGAVLILLFLVQILVTLYRYNFRLASYYDGRAYALELMNSGNEESFQALVGALSPEVLDFGIMPKTPTEHAIVLAEKIVQAARTKGGE